MKKLIAILLIVCGLCFATACTDDENEIANKGVAESSDMRIIVSDGTYSITFELNNSPASQSLYAQLPLSVEVSNYSNNEKIFYPPEALSGDSAIKGKGGAGTLAYYAPWKDVVLFYGAFSANDSLYILGYATDGADDISKLSGIISVSAA